MLIYFTNSVSSLELRLYIEMLETRNLGRGGFWSPTRSLFVRVINMGGGGGERR